MRFISLWSTGQRLRFTSENMPLCGCPHSTTSPLFDHTSCTWTTYDGRTRKKRDYTSPFISFFQHRQTRLVNLLVWFIKSSFFPRREPDLDGSSIAPPHIPESGGGSCSLIAFFWRTLTLTVCWWVATGWLVVAWMELVAILVRCGQVWVGFAFARHVLKCLHT